MHRFFHSHLDTTQKNFLITDPKEIHHLRDVLRLKKGDMVGIFDKQGTSATALIISLENGKIALEVDRYHKSISGETLLTLACAIPKKAKFEFIIEKCTELGVSEIVPLKTARTELAMSSQNTDKKNLRYERVAISASKQSGRTTVPHIYPITKFSDAVNFFDANTLILIPCLMGQRKNIVDVLSNVSAAVKKIIVFIGPEGDFTEEEVSLALQKGALPVSLGPTTLKVDTAALSTVAMLNFYLHAKNQTK